ncbi:MAG: hypothetical protein A2138_01885 [Deltaproteobacteria bacterium RBG_16_71_12]|nr:MAG: hypothetical protein A2138_01885 [Deltaproteobacteria bacterium RBG_16_71_12]
MSDGEPREHFRYLISARRYGQDKGVAWYAIYDERGRMIEECYTANDERPWRGREPSACRFQLGDIVAVLPLRPGGGRACIGVVNALPASPAWSEKLGLSLEAHEDVYLVGFPAPEGATEPSFNHDHPTQGVLVRVTSPVSPSLLRRLGHRFFEFRRGELHNDEGNAFVKRHRARLERQFGFEWGES